MVVAFYFRLHLAYFPRPVVAIFARPEQMTSFLKDKLCLSCIDFLPILCYLIDTERVSPMYS